MVIVLIEAVACDQLMGYHLLLIGSDDGVSSCLEKRELSANMCEEKSMMWTLHHAVILKGNHYNMLIC